MGTGLPDTPLTALPFLRFLVALKSKQSWDSVTAASSIKSNWRQIGNAK